MIDSKFLQEHGVSNKTVELALERAVQNAFADYLNVLECEVDLDTRVATAIMQVDQDLLINEARVFSPGAVEGDRLPVTFDLESLPEEVMEKVKSLLIEIIPNIHAEETYHRFKPMVHRAVRGIIDHRGRDLIDVDLGSGLAGLFPRVHWTKNEEELYRPGEEFTFYVLRVLKEEAAVVAILSRNSIELPCAILRQEMPWADFRCLRRIAGYKSWIQSNDFVRGEIREKLVDELRGELVDISFFSWLLQKT
jgi:hypothetical protein